MRLLRETPERVTQLPPYPLEKFNLRNATSDDLIDVVEVSASLCISYGALTNYLASEPELGICTLIRLSITRQTTTILADSATEQSYTIKDRPRTKKARFPQLKLILRGESSVDGGSSHQVNCKAIFILQPQGDKSLPGLYVCTDEMTLDSFPVVEGDSLLLPFSAFIFLVGAARKILYLSQNDLRHVKKNGSYSVPGPPTYGRDITLKLNSVPLN
jgi:hypothetical protein